MIRAKSQDSIKAYELVSTLQKRFVDKLDNLSSTLGENKKFEEVLWLRDEGIHGGGNRFEAKDEILFNTASVNVSQVHYDEDENKALQSATAISTIIHPKNPNVPSIHIHISLTCLRNKSSYWRVMADLNPSLENKEDKDIFDKVLKDLAKNTYEEGVKQGEKYFFIPALNRHRGVSHFYLENFKTNDKEKDFDFAFNFGKGVIDTYIDIISNAFQKRTTFSVQDIKKQLDYHTLYLFQVLSLDRGTTSGLLVHNQNDIGIMGSLPSFINKILLKSWEKKVEKPQDELINNLVNEINDRGIIDKITKEKLAQKVREHYKKYPQALKYQASGNVVPDTVNNHIK
jgi:coproporphyrinogen III oxidase